MNKNELDKRIVEMEKILEANNIYCELIDYSAGSLFDVVEFRIYRGDWKHEHLAFDITIEDNFGDVYKIVEKDINSDGSDCYDSTHKVYFVSEENKSLLDKMAVLFN